MTTHLDRIARSLEHLGFANFAIGSSFNSNQIDHRVTLRPDWQEHYFANNYLKQDPLPPCALAARNPITWDFLQKMFPKNAVMQEARDFGMSDGFAFSFRGFVVSAPSETKLSERDLTHIKSTVMSAVRECETPACKLTERQRGLILLSSAGLTVTEIAEMQGVAPSSVKDMRAAIFQRLGVSSMPQAIGYMRHITDET